MPQLNQDPYAIEEEETELEVPEADELPPEVGSNAGEFTPDKIEAALSQGASASLPPGAKPTQARLQNVSAADEESSQPFFSEEQGDALAQSLANTQAINSAGLESATTFHDSKPSNFAPTTKLMESLSKEAKDRQAAREKMKSDLIAKIQQQRKLNLDERKLDALIDNREVVNNISSRRTDAQIKKWSEDPTQYSVQHVPTAEGVITIKTNTRTGEQMRERLGSTPERKSVTEDRHMRHMYVNGLGLASDADSKKKMQGAAKGYHGMKENLADLKALYDKYGSNPLPGEAKDLMQNLAGHLTMVLKDYYGLGAPQKAELDFLDRQIKDPTKTMTTINDMFGSNPARSMANYMDILEKGYHTSIGQYIQVPEDVMTPEEKQIVSADRRNKSEMKGVIKDKPAGQYSPDIEERIKKAMAKNNASREKVIEALKAAGKLK